MWEKLETYLDFILMTKGCNSWKYILLQSLFWGEKTYFLTFLASRYIQVFHCSDIENACPVESIFIKSGNKITRMLIHGHKFDTHFFSKLSHKSFLRVFIIVLISPTWHIPPPIIFSREEKSPLLIENECLDGHTVKTIWNVRVILWHKNKNPNNHDKYGLSGSVGQTVPPDF